MLTDSLTLSPALYAEMMQKMHHYHDAMTYSLLAGNPPYSATNTFYGTPIRSSAAVAHQFQCSKCHGTGEGDESTYCEHCDGAGQVNLVGMIEQRGTTAMIRDTLPKAFAPYFAATVAAPQLCRGLPSC